MRVSHFVVVGAIAVALGCSSDKAAQTEDATAAESARAMDDAGPPPAYYFNPAGNPHPDCPPGANVVAAGSSDEKAAEAANAARAGVVKQIRSTIQVEVKRVMEVVSDGSDASVSRSLSQATREEATFDHGELVRLVEGPTLHQGSYYALACLNRAEAHQAILGDIEKDLALFEDHSQRAFSALEATDNRGFTDGYRAAMTHAVPALRGLALASALTGPSTQEATFKETHNTLLKSANGLRADSRVHIVFDAEGFSGPQLSSVREAFATALGNTGVPTSIEDAACADGILS